MPLWLHWRRSWIWHLQTVPVPETVLSRLLPGSAYQFPVLRPVPVHQIRKALSPGQRFPALRPLPVLHPVPLPEELRSFLLFQFPFLIQPLWLVLWKLPSPWKFPFLQSHSLLQITSASLPPRHLPLPLYRRNRHLHRLLQKQPAPLFPPLLRSGFCWSGTSDVLHWPAPHNRQLYNCLRGLKQNPYPLHS